MINKSKIISGFTICLIIGLIGIIIYLIIRNTRGKSEGKKQIKRDYNTPSSTFTSSSWTQSQINKQVDQLFNEIIHTKSLPKEFTREAVECIIKNLATKFSYETVSRCNIDSENNCPITMKDRIDVQNICKMPGSPAYWTKLQLDTFTHNLIQKRSLSDKAASNITDIISKKYFYSVASTGGANEEISNI